jgi:uncharacterized membrane protein (GlpM family)
VTGELALRVLLGGAIVSLFAAVGETVKPKTFAGLFGAAPSVAIVTLGMAFHKHGAEYAATEARSMLLGALAFFVYGAACIATTKWRKIPVWLGAGLAWGAWAVAASLPWAALRAAGGAG